MIAGDFYVGGWLVQPSLDRVHFDGRAYHLRPKTMRVLVELADHAGQVVTRDELFQRVWCDVHVSDEGLNHCIAEIRSTFGDEPHQPKFIETVAKHGYRLVAPVRPVDVPAPEALDRPAAGGDCSSPRGWTTLAKVGGLAVAALVVAGSAMVGVRWLAPSPAAEARTVVLADWVNRTGDPVFDETLKQALAIKLGESTRVRVVARERVAQALRLMRQPPQTVVTDQVARDVCQRVGGDTVLSGEIARMGEEYVILVEVSGCASAMPIAQARAEAADKRRVLGALDRVVGDLMDGLGEGSQAAGASARSIQNVTTANLEALRTFSLANDALAEGKVTEAIGLFDHAILLDPEFALAHSRLGSTLASIREWRHANEHRDRALALVKDLTAREQLYVHASYMLGQGRVTEAEATLKTWSRLYPGDRVPLGWLAVCHLNRGEQDPALTWAEAASKVDPTPATQLTLASVFLNIGRVDDARTAVSGLGEPGFRFVLAFLDGDAAEMDRQRRAVAPGSVEELDMRAREAQAAMAGGRIRAGRQLTGRAETLGLRLGLAELTAQVLATQAVWEAEIADARLGVEMAKAALSLCDDTSTRALAALAFARARAPGRVEAILTRSDADPPRLDPAILAGCRRKLRGALELALNRPENALRELEGLDPYENGGVVNLVALRGDVAELGVFHLRGRARLALGQGDLAAAEFQKIIDRRSVSPLSPYSALAPLNLGRARSLSGDLSAARIAYEAFFKSWSAADPDAAPLADAKREYQKLTAGRAKPVR
jgi:DNA-binding winged helix-turn-helix (wHTH) protein/tetratricopeptide (TPR) repeat protein